ncbi:MAG: MMPL family transporter [Opitutaceae bacterium]|nr:MMPL family transporter [Opitutaceae bacterium]
MNLRRRRQIAWSVLAACAVLGGGWLLRMDYARAISTDVLDLVPTGERDPELALVRELASEAEARTMLFVLAAADGRPPPLEAAARFAAALKRSPAFREAIPLADPASRDAAGRTLFELRMALLFPRWLQAREQSGTRVSGEPIEAARDAAARLKRFVASPDALAFQDLIPADPLLLLPDAIEQMKAALPLVQGSGDGSANGRIWGQLADSPLSEAGQAPAFAAIEHATAEVRAAFPGLIVSFTGVNRFAAASRARIEREVSWLNVLSLTAVLAVAAIFIRGVHRALHLLPVVAFAVLGAWVATTMVFPRVHIVVFVLGALLTGVAIDYGFYLYMQPPAGPGEDYWAKVRRLLKPLLASCFTTVVGFALLLLSDLPLIRQLGLFVGVGLLCALAAAVIYFSTVRNPFLNAREFRLGQAFTPAVRRKLRWTLSLTWLVAVAGLGRVTWRDDIRELEIPSATLKADDARIRAQFGDGGDRTVYLTYGATFDEARGALDKFAAWLRGRAEFGNLAPLIPTRAEFEHAVQFARHEPQFPKGLAAALEREGFAAAEFEPFFEAYRAFSRSESAVLDAAVERLHQALTGPPGLLWHRGPRVNWFVTVARTAPGEAPPASMQTVAASQLQSLNRLFANYRRSALRLSLAGLALVGLGVFLTYGVRDGIRIFAIPCGACLGIFGVFGWIGHPLNLFHLLGAFLGVCLTHNYSIFSATSAYRREPPPVSVRLSALTTAASFGVLALSGIPVVRALGITVSTMVVAALCVIELEHLGALGERREAK